MAKKKRELTGRYREGAKGYCWECGRPEREHRKGLCPHLDERNDVTGRAARDSRGKALGTRTAGGVGVVR